MKSDKTDNLEPGLKKYDLIFSLGASCACALYMKKAGLRTFASPFDWLIHADFQMRMKLLMNGFEAFMNPEDFRPAPLNPAKNKNSHTVDYENTHTGFYYYHDFPADCSFEESFPEVKQKYLRRIERFYSLLKTRRRILMIWFAHEWKTEDDVIRRLWTEFCGKTGKKMDLLVVENCPDMPYGAMTHYDIQDNILRFCLRTDTMDENGLRTTLGDEEHCLRIFERYALSPSWGYAFRRGLVKVIARVLCLLLPVKKWRKRLRQYARYY